ncbi:MAG: alpha/beta fold hydrolase [Opitutales bacterium]|nr:alpha/beta fold hydrolase [Opitutales bacterium]
MEAKTQRFAYPLGSTELNFYPAENPNAPTIIALHGFTGLGSDFALCAHAAHRAFSWVCPDLPGHGRHETRENYPEAFSSLLEKLHETFPAAHLLGYSMGARLLLVHSITKGMNSPSLTLISATGGIEGSIERRQRVENDAILAERLLSDGLHTFLEFWANTPLIQTQENIPAKWKQRMRQQRLMRHSPKNLATALRQFSPGVIPTVWEQLRQISAPTLLSYGEQDGKYANYAKRLHQLIPDAALSAIPGSGHAPHLESPELFAKSLQNFIKKQ